jgi:predicted dehydrogenase
MNPLITLPDGDRRKFLINTGKGLLALSAMDPLRSLATGAAHPPQQTLHPGQQTQQTSQAAQQPPQAAQGGREPISVQLPPLNDPSEQEEAPFPSVLAPDQRLGYCIVGLGHLSLGEILPAFAKSKYSRPVALVSGDAAKAASVAAQYGISPKGIYNYQNFDQIKNNKEIDIVYIVLPNSMHEEFAVRAAQAGKHILCEKPMATSSASAQRMIDACKKAGRKLMIAYRIQYEPFNKLVMQWSRNQEFGKVKLIESFNSQNIGDPKQWRLNKALAGGGPLPDMGIYNLNTTRYILGEEPEWVSGHVYTTPGDNRFKEVEESVLFQFGFPSGALANAATSYGVHQTRRYRCTTDKGAWYGMDPSYSYNGLRLELSQAKGPQEYRQQVLMAEKDQFAIEMDHMSTCVWKDQPPFTPGEEGLQDLKIIEAIYQSAREGKPVKLESISKKDAFRGTRPEEK